MWTDFWRPGRPLAGLWLSARCDVRAELAARPVGAHYGATSDPLTAEELVTRGGEEPRPNWAPSQSLREVTGTHPVLT